MSLVEQEVLETREKMWQEYWRTGNIDSRNEIALEYAYIVRLYAFQLRGIYESYADLDDMINQGTIALLEAIEKYDPDKKAKFESYASIRIKGSIIDYVRKQDWVAKRSKKEAKNIDEAVEVLTNQLGHVPDVSEIADYLQMTPKAIEKSMGEVHTFRLLSYEELVDIGLYGAKGFREKSIDITEQPGYSVEESELRSVISDSLNDLTEKEKTVITLYYFEELKKKDIAYVLDISASRVCQIHNSALKKMKKKLVKYLLEDEEQ